MRVLRVLLSSFLAGVMIGIGGSVYLSLENKVAGALLFAVGLFTIIYFGFHLYTGRVCYVLSGEGKLYHRVQDVLVTVVGNVLGTFTVGLALSEKLLAAAVPLCDKKLGMPLWQAFVCGIFCNILIYVAVEGYKVAKDGALKATIVFLGVSVFILAGFEHSVADMFYFAAARSFTVPTFVFLLVVILGNAVGGILFHEANHLYRRLCERAN